MVFHKLNNVWLLFEINSFLIKVTIEIFMGTHLFGSPCTLKKKTILLKSTKPDYSSLI